VTETTLSEHLFANPEIWTELCADINKMGNSVWIPLYKNGILIGVQKVRELSRNRLLLGGYQVGIY